MFIVNVWVLRPAGLAVAARLAIIVAVEEAAVFVQHRKSQRKSHLKKAASARQPPKKEANAAGQQRREAVIAGNMRNEWGLSITCCKTILALEGPKVCSTQQTPYTYLPQRGYPLLHRPSSGLADGRVLAISVLQVVYLRHTWFSLCLVFYKPFAPPGQNYFY